MRGPWWNAHGVASTDIEFPVAQGHSTMTVRDVVKLFGFMVAMKPGGLARPDHCFRKALACIAVPAGMHQFPDFRIIPGHERNRINISRLHVVKVIRRRPRGAKLRGPKHRLTGEQDGLSEDQGAHR